MTKITKDEIKHVISGTNKGVDGSNIQSVANYLKGSSYSVSKAEGEKQFKKEEIEYLEKYINENNLWYLKHSTI